MRFLLATAMLALLGAGCASPAYASPAYATDDVATWAAGLEGAYVLDTRTPSEHAQGRIAGSYLIPYDVLEDHADRLPADKDTPVHVYCQTGRRSAIAAQTLADMGYTDVHSLDGGIVAWVQAGYPVEAA